MPLPPLSDLDPQRFETVPIFRLLVEANRRLAELKGVAASTPNQNILINTLTLLHIVRTKPDYYRLLQAVRDDDAWEDWVLYMLEAVSATAAETIRTVQAIKVLLQDTKQRLRIEYRFYSQDLLNNLFNHPYTRVEFLQRELGIARATATKYLGVLASDGVLDKIRAGRNNYYVNRPLFDLLSRESMREEGA